ncbi:hypothetical protein PF001_g28786 [Phytophthora fragariae]|uniref:FAD/NAD(P)-binding domain-containing protein n=1 Tax=Phytophthora fragariae TaxID=53985 RepID=A0A6A4BGD7_9STRA|nr:hypothetical protein PF001_g28786 [Phytophthora fragariae]
MLQLFKTTSLVTFPFVSCRSCAFLAGNLLRDCRLNDVKTEEPWHLYYHIKAAVYSKLGFRKKQLFRLLDARFNVDVYKQKPAAKKRVCIVGAGPVGLRAAVELALLGSHVSVLEKRTKFNRENMLHLWPWVVQDVGELGGGCAWESGCGQKWKDRRHRLAVAGSLKDGGRLLMDGGRLRDGRVVKKNHPNPADLVQADNINQDAFHLFVNEIVNFVGIPRKTDFARLSIFDFSSLARADKAASILTSHGKKLYVGFIGDSLLEPVWHEGVGTCRGFLSALDAVWMVAQIGKMADVQLLADREFTYRIMQRLSGHHRDEMHKNVRKYTVDPKPRYTIDFPCGILGV